ncbi:MAG: amino acid racemase [Nanoarchaeota archaeon]|nr:amino acid racemase [Nanoarchaeota archaeon]
MLGGMGPEAAAELYRRIIRLFQRKYDAKYDDDFPEILLMSIPLPDVVEKPQEIEKIELMLTNGVKNLEIAGADFIVIPCNTVTYFLPAMRKAVSISLIDIVEETAKEVANQKLRKVGLLATEFTVNRKLYNRVLPRVGFVFPRKKEQMKVTSAIMNVLSGRKKQKDRKLLRQLIEKMTRLGAEKVILGCTEIPLLTGKSRTVIDTLDVLAKAAVRESTKPSGL